MARDFEIFALPTMLQRAPNRANSPPNRSCQRISARLHNATGGTARNALFALPALCGPTPRSP